MQGSDEDGPEREAASVMIVTTAAAYKDTRRLGGWRKQKLRWRLQVTPGPRTEEDFKPQRVKIQRGSTSEQTWEVEVGKKWISSQHQNIGGQVSSDPLRKMRTFET